MNVNRKRVKIFNRILNKHKVSLEFITLNFGKVLKLFQYATQHHFVIKRSLVIKNKKVVIKYNTLRKKLLFSKKNKKKGRRDLPWSKKVLIYLKKQRASEKICGDIEGSGDNLDESMSPDEIQKKIKEQLELLKSGRKTVPLLGDSIKKPLSKESFDDISACGTPTSSKEVSLDLNKTNGNQESISESFFESTWNESNVIVVANVSDLGLNSNSNENSTSLEKSVDDEDIIKSDSSERLEEPDSSKVGTKSKSGMKFLDLLINKMKKTTNSNTTAVSAEKENITDNIKRQGDSSKPTDSFQEELLEQFQSINETAYEKLDSTSEVVQLEHRQESRTETIEVVSSNKSLEQIEVITSEPTGTPISTNNTNSGSKIPRTGALNGEETSSSSSEFLGFSEYELAPCTVPGMLPTPIVTKSTRDDNQSAFISEDLEKFLRENSLEQFPEVELPKQKNFEDGLVCDGAPPPKMVMPIIPKELTKPRTVAEKRHVLQRKQSIKYYMIENENTIYRELKKRTKLGKVNLSLVRHIQDVGLPSTRDCWKASSWLSTENGRFYFQIINVDGCEVKLIGGKGNHTRKSRQPQSSKPHEGLLSKECPPGCRQNVDFRNIKINNLPSDDEGERDCDVKFITAPDLKLQIGSVDDDKPAYKPGPLSRKCLSSPFEPNLGELEIYEMPDVKLEVFPAVDKPLDEHVRPYLKLILPSGCITREWAEFAVSTLVSKYQSEEENPKSFTFTIPYRNNQKNVLVRKVYNRKEKLEKFSTEDFNFCKSLNTEDDIAVECADVLSEMINSVAIGLSEDSLIKEDPDIDYLNNTKINAEISQRDSGEEKVFDKKNTARKKTARDKLVLELKKLNATVIDAECLFTQEDKICKNVHCELGCVCHSLSGQPILRKHCKKTSCMLECTCKRSVTSDLDNLVNSSLTTEDALLIRKKATAKMATVEKDFCATVVLTDKETFLINEPNNERKRSKRAPKRFDDYDTIEKKTNLNETFSAIPKLYPYDDEPPPKKFKHCTVDLQKLMGLDDLEPWCMIHCLYKCFCRGKATAGVPFEIKKDEAFEKDEEDIIYSKKRLYSFDKDDDRIDNDKNNSDRENASKNTNLLTEPAPKRKNTSMHLPDPSGPDFRQQYAVYEKEIDLKRRYYHAGNNLCKRLCIVPSKVYRDINRRRAHRIQRKIRASEDAKTRFILIDKINKSLRYKPPQVEKHESRSLLKRRNPQLESLENNVPANQFDLNYQEMQSTTLSSSLENSNANESKFPVISSVCSLNNSSDLNLKLGNTSSVNLSTSSSPSRSVNQFIPESNSSSNVSSDMSLNSTIANNFLNEIPNNPQNMSKHIHSISIKKLNTAVTKTMHSICAIQKKNTKHIPAPVPNTLSSHQWKLFLQAYIEGLVYVWEIRIAEGSFIAATVTNIMPIVPNALSVINIKAIPKSKLPLLGKMLNARLMDDKTKTLSVLMTGQKNFWRIIGFINSSYDYLNKGGIFKPTPQSHPWLSKKINTLFKMLILRQFQDGTESAGMQERGFNSVKPSVVSATATIQDVGIPVLQIPPSNLEIRKVTHSEIEGIVIPMAVLGDHRWLVLDLFDDFSHIYIPAWKNFLSHDRIKKAVLLSQGTKKIVRIGQEKTTVDVFATPVHPQRIYMGPYSINKLQDIVLYQNIDSRMMLREDFEISQNISRTTKTTGFWLYKKNGKLIFDMDLKALQMSDVMRIQTEMRSPDEDCIIVEAEKNADKNECVEEQISNVTHIVGTSTSENNSEATTTVNNSTDVGINNPHEPAGNANRILECKNTENTLFSSNSSTAYNSALGSSNITSTIEPRSHSSKQNFVAKKVAGSQTIQYANVLKKQLNKTSTSGNLLIGTPRSVSSLPTAGSVSTMKVTKISSANKINKFYIIKNPPCSQSKLPVQANLQLQEKEISLAPKDSASLQEETYKSSETSNPTVSEQSLTDNPQYSAAQTVDNRSLQPIISSVQTLKPATETSASILKSTSATSSIHKLFLSTPEVKNTSVAALSSKNVGAAKLFLPSSNLGVQVATLSVGNSQNSKLSNSAVTHRFMKKLQTEPQAQIKTCTLKPQLTSNSHSTASTNITKNALPISSATSLSSQMVLTNRKAAKLSTGRILPTAQTATTSISCPQMTQTTTAVKKIYLTTVAPSGQPNTSTVFSTPSSSTGSPGAKLLITNVSSGSLMHTSESTSSKPVMSLNKTSDAVGNSNHKSVRAPEFSYTISDNPAIGKLPVKKLGEVSSGAKLLITNVSSGSLTHTSESTLIKPAISLNNTNDTVGKSDYTSDSSQIIHAPEFGYIISDNPSIGKFPVKKLGEVYLLKMPFLKGILRIMGMEMVNKYLAQYMKKHADQFPLATGKLKWRFVPHETLKGKNIQTPRIDVQKIITTKEPDNNEMSDAQISVIGKIAKSLHSPQPQEMPPPKKVTEFEASESKLLKLKDFTIKKEITQKSCGTSNEEQTPALKCQNVMKGVMPKQPSATASTSRPLPPPLKLLTAGKASGKILQKVKTKSNPPSARPQSMQTKPASEVILIDDDD